MTSTQTISTAAPDHVSTLRGWLKSRRRFFAGTSGHRNPHKIAKNATKSCAFGPDLHDYVAILAILLPLTAFRDARLSGRQLQRAAANNLTECCSM